MQSSWENELISLKITDGSSFEIFAKDIQKTAGRLSFERDENNEVYFEIEEVYRRHHYASNALYVFVSAAHSEWQVPVIHAKLARINEDAMHVIEHNGFQRIAADEDSLYYAHHCVQTRQDDDYHPAGRSVLYLAGGCFWGMEKVFQQLDGVTDTTVGYANGHTDNPTYEEVCRNETGYKETVRVTFDPETVSLETILKAYFLCIDPTHRNRQGNDFGTQYQTGVYYRDQFLAAPVNAYFTEEKRKHVHFFVECCQLTSFYEAEEYHQDYLDKNPQGYCHITPVELEEVRALNCSKHQQLPTPKNF